MIFVCFCLGMFVAWLFRQLKDKNIYEKIAAAVEGILILVLLPSDIILKAAAEGMKVDLLAVRYVVLLAAFILEIVWGSQIEKAVQWLISISDKMVTEGRDKTSDAEEEDLMKTKYGKIMTAVCILLVIYMIGSAICIIKLNQKINTVYEITQEMGADAQKE